jgi:hypothetical protein
MQDEFPLGCAGEKVLIYSVDLLARRFVEQARIDQIPKLLYFVPQGGGKADELQGAAHRRDGKDFSGFLIHDYIPQETGEA